MTEERANAVPDGLELVKDGTVRAVVGDERYKLRRPKLGELQDMRELLAEVDDDSIRALGHAEAEKVLVEQKYPEAERAADGTMRTEHMLAVRAIDRAMAATLDARRADWTRAAWALLGDKPLPDDTREWEPWLVNPVTISQLMGHWQAVPLARGVG